jgi:hypothetical protein
VSDKIKIINVLRIFLPTNFYKIVHQPCSWTFPYENISSHIQIIQALSKKNKGLTRKELAVTAKIHTGGTLSNVLDELTESGSIEKMYPFSNYFRFMHNVKDYEEGQWLAQSTTPAYLSWCGYAFENVCLRHIPKIKKALGINGVLSSQSSWYKSGAKNSKGAQIDLLIDRNDRCINVCEMKCGLTKDWWINPY